MRKIILITTLLLSITIHAALPGLSDSLSMIIGDRNIGVAIISSNGDTITAGNSGMFKLAGVAKFHQATVLSRKIDFDTLIHKRITISDRDLKRDVWSPLRASYDGTPFSISPVELLDYSLNMSDDNASAILANHLNLPIIDDATSTALDAGRLIYRFFTSDTTASATMVKAIMARETPFGRERIPAGVSSSSTKVFHKAGTDNTGSIVNDLAFISYPTGRGYACYSLAVLTQGMPIGEAENIIAEISRIVYTSVIVRESLVMNASTIVPAGKRQTTDTGLTSDDGSITWVDIMSEVLFNILDRHQ